ncbi:hypothetical protein NL676_037554 [Syzygium grande]|nr:hypothetical protein NL676_037554 [Syzygium grande]
MLRVGFGVRGSGHGGRGYPFDVASEESGRALAGGHARVARSRPRPAPGPIGDIDKMSVKGKFRSTIARSKARQKGKTGDSFFLIPYIFVVGMTRHMRIVISHAQKEDAMSINGPNADRHGKCVKSIGEIRKADMIFAPLMTSVRCVTADRGPISRIAPGTGDMRRIVSTSREDGLPRVPETTAGLLLKWTSGWEKRSKNRAPDWKWRFRK